MDVFRVRTIKETSFIYLSNKYNPRSEDFNNNNNGGGGIKEPLTTEQGSPFRGRFSERAGTAESACE